MKFTKEEVVIAVKKVLEDGYSFEMAAKESGMARTLLKEYVTRIREHGYTCLRKSPNYTTYDGEFKVHVVDIC